MLGRLVSWTHNYLEKKFESRPRYLGRVYAFLCMLSGFLSQLCVKLTSG